jgi:flagellin-specific chaperone FliS
MMRRITHGDVNGDIGAIDEVIGMLSELLSAWQEVASKPDTEIQAEGESFYEDRNAMAPRYVSA